MSIDKIYYACVGLHNFGDQLSIWLAEKLTGNQFGFSENRELIISGSVLQDAKPETVVFGAGFGELYQTTKAKYISYVRGELTRQMLRYYQNQAQPQVFEPAYCLREFFEDVKPDIEIGYIPHYIDDGILKQSEWLNIGICTGIENVMRQMLRCKKIITSSLHGMVIADLFERPSCLVKVSDRIAGDGYKYIDYWSFVEKMPYRAIPIHNKESIYAMLDLIPQKFTMGMEAKMYLRNLTDYLKTLCD